MDSETNTHNSPDTSQNVQPLVVKDELQEKAIQLACSTDNRIVGVTGQAGTGKTTIMRQVYQAFTDAGHSVALCAPTGKAAKRISEATGIQATTIHKLLEYTHPGDPDPKTGKVLGISVPRRGPGNPLVQSIVLGDEYSMVNEELNRSLMDAMPAGGLVRMFGDANQLPPIEEGDFNRGGPRALSPFEKYLKQFPSVKLTHIYRQGEGSGIVKNGHRIINGMCPAQMDDFKITITNQHKDKIVDYVMESGIDFASLDNQIITPTNKSVIGTIALNIVVQELLQGDKMFAAHVMPRSKWDKTNLVLVVGDKVLWTKNDYQLEIYNGETGIVTSLDNDLVTIDFGDRVLAVPPWVEYLGADGKTKGYDPRTQLQLAYVITTHKSQGSEYQHVAYMMGASAWMLQNRANFYTAITRARKHVHVISDQRSFQGAVIR
jgi:exodeoxyribonuclease V alpha subunit